MKKPKKLPSPYKFADGGPLHDRDINGKLLQSTYASALGNMFREGGPFGEDQGVFDYATSIYASQPGNYYAQGGMIKRADGSYSQRGLWDNIRAAAAKNRAAGKPGKEPSKEMLRQGEKINREYRTGGQFPRPYSLPEDSFKQGGTNLHNSVYASSSAPYPGIYADGGVLGGPGDPEKQKTKIPDNKPVSIFYNQYLKDLEDKENYNPESAQLLYDRRNEYYQNYLDRKAKGVPEWANLKTYNSSIQCVDGQCDVKIPTYEELDKPVYTPIVLKSKPTQQITPEQFLINQPVALEPTSSKRYDSNTGKWVIEPSIEKNKIEDTYNKARWEWAQKNKPPLQQLNLQGETFADGGPIIPAIATYNPALSSSYAKDYAARLKDIKSNPIDPKTGAPYQGSGGTDASSTGTGGNYRPLNPQEKAAKIAELEALNINQLRSDLLEQYLSLKNNKPYFVAAERSDKFMYEPYDLRTYTPMNAAQLAIAYPEPEPPKPTIGYATDPYTGKIVPGVSNVQNDATFQVNRQMSQFAEAAYNTPEASAKRAAIDSERLNNMELLKTMTPEQKAAMRAAGLTPTQYLANPSNAGANKFAEGGSILSMSNTPQLEGEGKDLTYPDGAYVYNYGGKLFAPGGPIYPTNQQLAQFLNPEYQRVTQGQEVTVRPNAYQMQQAKNKAVGINKYDAINIKPKVAESTKPDIAPVDKKVLDRAIAQKTAERKVVAKEIKNSPLLTQEQKQEILMSPQKLDENAYLAYQKKPDVLKAAKEYTAADKATNILRNPLVAASYFMKPGTFNMPMNYSELERSPNYSDETWNRNAVGQGLNTASYFHPAGLALHMADNALYTATDLDKALESGKSEDWKQAGLSAVNTALDLVGSRYIGGSGRLLNAGEQATLNAMNTSNRLGLNPSVNTYLGTRVFPNINSSVVRSADDIAAARLVPQINPNSINYNPSARNLYNNAVTAGNVQNTSEAIQSNPFNIDELRRVYHNSERFLTPEESRFLSQQGRGEAIDYSSEANRARNSSISPDEAQGLWAQYSNLRESGFDWNKPEKIIKNRSGLTKEEALKKVIEKDKDIISTMNSTDFENTVLKPTGEVVQYKPRAEVSQIIDDTALKQMRLVDQVPMTSEEYATAFNERLDLLNDIIAQKNKSGVEYRVTGLTPYGKLEFYTPKQKVTRQMSEKRTAEYNDYLKDPEKFITKRAGLRQNNSGKWVFNDDISAQRFNTKEEALDWAKADVEQFIGPEISEIEGTSDWTVNIKPGQWRGEVEDIANAEYYSNIPGLNMSMTSRGVFSDSRPRKGSGAYESINEYLKQLDLGRVKPGFNSQTDFSRGAWENFIKSGRAYGYYANPSTVYGTMKAEGGFLQNSPQTTVSKYPNNSYIYRLGGYYK